MRSFHEDESVRCEKPATPSPPSAGEFLPRTLLQDPEFSARIKREAHLMRNEAIREALAMLVRWIAGKTRMRR